MLGLQIDLHEAGVPHGTYPSKRIVPFGRLTTVSPNILLAIAIPNSIIMCSMPLVYLAT